MQNKTRKGLNPKIQSFLCLFKNKLIFLGKSEIVDSSLDPFADVCEVFGMVDVAAAVELTAAFLCDAEGAKNRFGFVVGK